MGRQSHSGSVVLRVRSTTVYDELTLCTIPSLPHIVFPTITLLEAGCIGQENNAPLPCRSKIMAVLC